jgi:mycothiol synthase
MTEFQIRHYNPETDLSALSQLLTEIESIDQDGEETSEEFLRSMLEWPNFDPDKNVWVAELDGVFVGYGQILPKSDGQCSMYVVVHPSQRGKGLGSQLLALILSRARETESKDSLVYVNGKNAASVAFMNRHGFAVAGTSGVMVAPPGDLPQAEIPDGYSIHRYPELGDPQIVVQALNDCYKDMVGHHQNVTSADRYMEYYGSEGIHLLFDPADKLIGICAGKPQGQTDKRGVSDLLDAPGLTKENRGKGFQRFLTLKVMNWLRQQGSRTFTLEYWGDDDQALEIYRSLGFELVQQQITYQKKLETDS